MVNDKLAIGSTNSDDHMLDRCSLPPLPVGLNIEPYGGRLNGRVFSPMRLAGVMREIRNVGSGLLHDTNLGARSEQW